MICHFPKSKRHARLTSFSTNFLTIASTIVSTKWGGGGGGGAEALSTPLYVACINVLKEFSIIQPGYRGEIVLCIFTFIIEVLIDSTISTANMCNFLGTIVHFTIQA